MQIGRHEHQPVGVSFGLANPHGAAGEVDVVAAQPAGLTRPQAQAVDHPEYHRDDQVPLPAERGGRDPVGGVEYRPQLSVGEEVRAVTNLFAGDAGRDDICGQAETGHVFGELPDRGDPAQLRVHVFTGPAGGPGHRHLAAQHVLPGIVAAHRASKARRCRSEVR